MIRNILLLQKRELEKKLAENYIEKDILLKNLQNDLIKVIAGPRRAGKSFFAMKELAKAGSFGYANFDDERLTGLKDNDELINALNSLYNNPKFLLFDEIQNLPKWELFANRLQRQGCNLVITGSNSKLLSRELSTHLTGRHSLITLLPFSFAEFLKLENKELTQSELQEKFFQYISYGGYPEPLMKKMEHKEYLSTLLNSILYKDIVQRFRIRRLKAIESLAFHLLSNIAREFSCNSLAEITDIKSHHTVEKYLSYLEEAFVFFILTRLSFKTKEQISLNKKIYCIDNGFIYSSSFSTSPNYGRLYENTAAIWLKKQELDGKLKLYYWKNQQGEEVDFVIMQGTKVKELIQVCYEIKKPKTKEREVRALIKGSTALNCKNLTVLTADYGAREKVKWFGVKRKINFKPLWKRMLE